MRAKIRKYLGPSIFADNNKIDFAGILRTLAVTLLIISPVVLVVGLLVNNPKYLWGVIITDVVVLGALWLLRRGFITLVSLLLPLVLLLLAMYFATVGHGLNDTALLMFPLIIILSGLLLGRAGVALFSLIAVFYIFFLFYAEKSNLIITCCNHLVGPDDVVAIIVILGTTALIFDLLNSRLSAALAQIQHNEQALRESEAKLRLIYENAYDGISIYEEMPNRSRRLIDCNERYAEIAGRSKEELLKIGNTSLVQKKVSPEMSMEEILRIRRENTPYHGLFSWIRPDGKENIIEYSAAPVQVGDRPWTIGLDRDITEHKQITKKLRENEARLEALRQIGLELAANLDLESLLQSIVTRAQTLLNGNRGGIFLHRPDLQALEMVATSDPNSPIPLGMLIKPGDGLIGQVWQRGQPIMTNDYPAWQEKSEAMTRLIASGVAPSGSIISTPVWGDNEILGVLIVTAQAKNHFSPGDAELLSLFAAQAAVAIRNARLHEQTQAYAGQLEQEVVERKRIEVALRTSDERYRTFIAQSTEGVSRYEFEPALLIKAPEAEQIERFFQDLYLAECNDAYARMYGFTSAHELVGMRFGGRFPRSNPENIAYLQTYIRSGYRFKDMESYEVNKEGEERYFSNNLIGIVEEGKLVRIWGVQRDITQRKQVEQALQEYSERLEEMVTERTAELEAEIIERKKIEGALRSRVVELEVVAQVSTAASTILDRPLLLQTVVELTRDHFNLSHVHIALLNETGEYLRMVASAGEIGQQVMAISPVLHLKRDRALATVAVTTRQCVVVNDVSQEPNYLAHPLLKEVQSEMVVPMFVGERLIGVIAIQSNQLNRFSNEDVAIHKILAAQVAVAVENARRFEELQQAVRQLQETQERLTRQEKLAVLGQLAGSVGHELRNPLGVINNALYFLNMVLSDAGETVKEYLDLIASRVSEADKIVADLLNLSRTHVVAREVVAVFSLVAETLQRYPPPEAVTIVTQVDTGLPPVLVDPQQIGQVLGNLVSNAYQAMPNGGALTISARSEPEWLTLSVADTGLGIASEAMEKIFEPLFTTKAKGIGLGLAVSKNLVEVNGGTIKVESLAGQGTTFTLSLPFVEKD